MADSNVGTMMTSYEELNCAAVAAHFTEVVCRFERANRVRILWLDQPDQFADTAAAILASAEHICLRNDAACATRAINKVYKHREELTNRTGRSATAMGNHTWRTYYFPAMRRVARILGKRCHKSDEDVAKIVAAFVSLSLMCVEELGGSPAFIHDNEVYEEQDFKIFFRRMHRALQWLMPLPAEMLILTEHDRYVVWKWIKVMLYNFNTAIAEHYATEMGSLYFELEEPSSPWFIPGLADIDTQDIRP